jgi:arylsulfatase A-like enzyme
MAGGADYRKPNIIFLLADDQRWDTMGCYGNPYIITPNMDKMASEGLRFENVYHVSPICQPSRASIMTGRYLSSHQCGFDRPTTVAISKSEFEDSYPVLLRKAGYRTGFVGKFGFPVADKKILNVGFPYPDEGRQGRSQLWSKPEYMPSEAFDRWNGFAGQGSYTTPKGHLTEVNASNACQFIADSKKSHPDKPFCLSVSFKAPHGPYTPMAKYRQLYDDIEIPPYSNDGVEYFSRLPAVVREQYRARGSASTSFLKNYFALITGVDAALGKIREELRKQGLEDNTVIIYTSDNGYFCGSKGLNGKDLLYEESVRAPLLYFDPRLSASRSGTKIAGLVSIIDLAPTLLDLAGLNKPASMQGFSLLPLVVGTKTEVRDSTFSENNFANFITAVEDAADDTERDAILEKGTVRSKCVRTNRYKYIRYHETRPLIEELWDIQADPLELNNLASDPAYAEALAMMRQRCDGYMQMTLAAAQRLSE